MEVFTSFLDVAKNEVFRIRCYSTSVSLFTLLTIYKMFGDKGSSKISSIRSPKSKFDSEMKRDATLRIYLHNSRKKNFSLLLPLQ